jgi:hypothetical protein
MTMKYHFPKRKDSVPVASYHVNGEYADRKERIYLHKKGPRHRKVKKK